MQYLAPFGAIRLKHSKSKVKGNQAMRLIWISLVFYLLVEAYFAVLRVAKKRRLTQYSAPDSSQNSSSTSSDRFTAQRSTSQTSTALPPSSPESAELEKAVEELVSDPLNQLEAPEMPVSEAVLASSDPASTSDNQFLGSEPETAPEIPHPAAEMPALESSESIASTSPEGSSPGTSSESASNPAGRSPAELDQDFILAASLSVTDIVHPQAPGEVEIPDLIPTDPAISEVLNANAVSSSDHHPSILEEIAELRPIADANQHSSTSDRTKHFMHALLTGDGTVRVAAVYELGEIAAQGSNESEQIIKQLQQLTQDEDPDVRSQAIVALEKVQR
jgi:hypothetical protein